MAPSHIVKCWNQHRTCLAVFSCFDTFISNSFTKVQAEKCSNCYSIKKTEVSSHFSFSRQEKAVGFIQCYTRPKVTEIGITLMLETSFGDRLESGFLLWLKNSSFLTEYDSKYLHSPDRIWKKIGQNPTGLVDKVYFYDTTSVQQWQLQYFPLRSRNCNSTWTKNKISPLSNAKAWGCIWALIFAEYCKHPH